MYWSPSSATALAEAELEYKEDHISKSAFVKFPITRLPLNLATHPGLDANTLHALIWTTTPWTLPANKAIAVHSQLEYAIVESPNHGQLLVAKSRIQYITNIVGQVSLKVIVGSIPGAELAGQIEYINVLAGRRSNAQPVIRADFVSADSGTGLVHCAPGHGADDYEACLKQNIPAFAPVDDHGRFTNLALPDEPSLLTGLEVLGEGSDRVLEYLQHFKYVLATHDHTHKYPYDWRTKLPVIVRATEQWFANVGSIKDSALESLQHVQFMPASGKARLESFVRTRSEWCISRQRVWGVPIPALYQKDTGSTLLTSGSVSHIMSTIERRGIDAWWTDPLDDPAWIPPELLSESGEVAYQRGRDTMDVWFDSGTSWTQLDVRDGGQGWAPADVYVEGSDQHRGWFQSSLLTRIAHQRGLPTGYSNSPQAPFKTLITHGFTLDKSGRKMSKSIGNVVSPEQIMDGSLLPPLKVKGKSSGEPAGQPRYDGLGPDALRLWVAGSDYTKDVIVGQPVLKAVNASLHKLRVTVKMLLGALHDFTPVDKVEYNNVTNIDRMALLQLANVNAVALEAYRAHEFHKAIAAINRWVNADLSAFYIETIKDRLYADGVDSSSRRSAQTTLLHVYDHLMGMLTPVTPLLVEEAWKHTPDAIRAAATHPLRRSYPTPPPKWNNERIKADLPVLLAANDAVKAAQERARTAKQLGSSLQSAVVLYLSTQETRHSTSASEILERHLPELEALFVVSSVSIVHGRPLKIHTPLSTYAAEFATETDSSAVAYILPPEGAKCIRCWRYAAPTDVEPAEALCPRCEAVLETIERDGGRQAATA